MALLEDIRKMRQQNQSDEEIVDTLRASGVPAAEIYEALSQAQIQTAVSGAEQTSYAPEGMQQSMTIEERAPPSPTQAPEETGEATYAQAPQAYAPEAYQQQPQGYQQQYATGVSAEAISEIAEQIIAEKLVPIRNSIEKAIDVKTRVETRVDAIEARIARIENIINALQSSVLQKVGAYMENVDDIKNELVETQKSFKALLPELRRQAKS